MSDLAFHVREYVPNCADGEELDTRIALLKARDWCCAQRGVVFTDWAINLTCEAHETAGRYVFADEPVDRLVIALRYCRNLVQAAYSAEHLTEEGRGW